MSNEKKKTGQPAPIIVIFVYGVKCMGAKVQYQSYLYVQKLFQNSVAQPEKKQGFFFH
jgi:hypothetical protein